MKRILVIEDEPQMRLGLRDNLELEGYEVETAADGDEGLQKAGSFSPDLVILDVMLPKKNGFDVCRDLRARSISTPIVMLTARSAETDKVLGLELGADDYVTKPFSITELLARVRAVLRRSGQQKPTADAIKIGDIEIDFKLHQARRGKQRIEFTAREFDLLRYFVQHTGQVVTREQILNESSAAYRPGGDARADPQRSVGLRGIPHHPHDRQFCRQAAAEDRKVTARPGAHPDDSRIRL
jgi:DNA-binding response OmpR family regulator